MCGCCETEAIKQEVNKDNSSKGETKTMGRPVPNEK